jgi:hypothetical protein
VIATVEVAGPFQVVTRPVTLKPRDRKPSVNSPGARVESVHLRPGPDDASLVAVVNGAGLADPDKDGFKEHGTGKDSMWLGHWTTNMSIEFELSEPVPVSIIQVWNYNEDSQTDRGIRKADIAVSSDGSTWKTILPGAEIAEASVTDYDWPSVLKLGGEKVTKIRFENIVPILPGESIGLSEVSFHETPGARACALQPLDGVSAVPPRSVTLTWTPVDDAKEYRVLMGASPAALAPCGTTNQTSLEMRDVKSDAVFFWRVDAVKADGSVVPGRMGRFETGGQTARWKLDETGGANAADTGGRSLTGSVKGTPQWASGKTGGALEFDGKETLVNCGDAAAFNFRDGMTVAAWIKVRKLDKEWQAVVTKGDTAWRFHRQSATGNLEFHCDGLTPLEQNKTTVAIKRSLTDDQWHHVAATYDGKRMAIYLDGTLQDSAKVAGQIATNSHPVMLGENAEKPGRLFNGWMDDVRLYSYGLSDEEVRALYQEGATPGAK